MPRECMELQHVEGMICNTQVPGLSFCDLGEPWVSSPLIIFHTTVVSSFTDNKLLSPGLTPLADYNQRLTQTTRS